MRVSIEQREGGSPIAVARLPDRSGINQVARRGFELQSDGFRLADGAVLRTKSVGGGAVSEKSALQMSMSEESQGNIQSDQRSQSVAERDDIFILVMRRSMHQLYLRKIRHQHGAVGQRPQPFEIVMGQLFTSPERGCRGHGVEVVEFHDPGCGFVVIAADKGFAQFARALGHFVGAGAVAHDIAQVDDDVERWSRGQACVKSLEVSVDVAENQYAQRSPDEVLIEVPINEVPIIDPAGIRATGNAACSFRIRGMRWHFKGKAPVSFKVVFALFAINVVAQMATTYAIQKWSPTQADTVHSYLIRFKGGVVYFVQPWLGNYFFYGAKANYVFLALIVLIFFLHRDEIERVG